MLPLRRFVGCIADQIIMPAMHDDLGFLAHCLNTELTE